MLYYCKEGLKEECEFFYYYLLLSMKLLMMIMEIGEEF